MTVLTSVLDNKFHAWFVTCTCWLICWRIVSYHQRIMSYSKYCEFNILLLKLRKPCAEFKCLLHFFFLKIIGTFFAYVVLCIQFADSDCSCDNNTTICTELIKNRTVLILIKAMKLWLVVNMLKEKISLFK